MRKKIAAITESKMKLKGAMETNNYIIKYSGVSTSTRTRAGVIIWIHKSIKNTVINYTYWSERITEVKLNIGRGKLSFLLDSTPQKKG
jgi:hypothetical protein